MANLAPICRFPDATSTICVVSKNRGPDGKPTVFGYAHEFANGACIAMLSWGYAPLMHYFDSTEALLAFIDGQ